MLKKWKRNAPFKCSVLITCCRGAITSPAYQRNADNRHWSPLRGTWNFPRISSYIGEQPHTAQISSCRNGPNELHKALSDTGHLFNQHTAPVIRPVKPVESSMAPVGQRSTEELVWRTTESNTSCHRVLAPMGDVQIRIRIHTDLFSAAISSITYSLERFKSWLNVQCNVKVTNLMREWFFNRCRAWRSFILDQLTLLPKALG